MSLNYKNIEDLVKDVESITGIVFEDLTANEIRGALTVADKWSNLPLDVEAAMDGGYDDEQALESLMDAREAIMAEHVVLKEGAPCLRCKGMMEHEAKHGDKS
jgi:hypothetical protein